MFLFSFVVGAAVGSFVHAWVWRLRDNLPIFWARSFCPYCRAHLAWHENIPIVGYLLVRGRCRHCHTHIASTYLISEIIVGFLFAIFAWHHHFLWGGELFLDWFIVLFLMAIFLYDVRFGEIPDLFTIFPSILLLLWFLVSDRSLLLGAFIGALVGAGFFWFQYVVSRGRWIGGGDIRLGGFMGIVLGWPLVLLALFFAYLLGAAISVILLAMKKKTWTDKTPFGTYLTAGTVIAMLYGENIMQWYLNFLR